jgi:hypothetical protein
MYIPSLLSFIFGPNFNESAINAPVTAPQVSPWRAMPPPKGEAMVEAISSDNPNCGANAEKRDWEHENPCSNRLVAVWMGSFINSPQIELKL